MGTSAVNVDYATMNVFTSIHDVAFNCYWFVSGININCSWNTIYRK